MRGESVCYRLLSGRSMRGPALLARLHPWPGPPCGFPRLALQMLVLHCMTITLQEINQRKEHLRQEILERECLLATLEVLHKHVAARGGATTIDLSTLFPAWRPGRDTLAHAPQVDLLESAPAALPPPAPSEPYIHPDLKRMRNHHGSNTMAVQWAIDRLTGDYVLGDIEALLAREGHKMQPAEISVVLSRLKKRGKITEIRCGYGRKPAIFRKTAASGAELTPAAA